MFCKFCGQLVPDGSPSCTICGASLASAPAPAVPPQQPSFQQPSFQQPSYAQPAPAAGSAGFGNASAGAAIAGLPVRLIAKIALVLALLAFFLPFVTVSCDMNKLAALGGGDATEVTEELGTDDFGWGPYSGFSIMFGSLDAQKLYGIPEDKMKEAQEEMEDEMSSTPLGDAADFGDGINIWMLLSFLCGAGAVAMLFVFEKKPNRMSHVCAGLGAGGALLLLIGRLAFLSNTKFDALSSYGDFVKAHTKWGFFLCLLFFIAGAAACFMDFRSQGGTGSSSPAAFPTGGYPSAQTPVNQFGNYNQPGPPMQ